MSALSDTPLISHRLQVSRISSVHKFMELTAEKVTKRVKKNIETLDIGINHVEAIGSVSAYPFTQHLPEEDHSLFVHHDSVYIAHQSLETTRAQYTAALLPDGYKFPTRNLFQTYPTRELSAPQIAA